MEMEKRKPFRVLTLDGGGMRGLYTAVLMQRLVQLFDVKYAKQTTEEERLLPDIGMGFDMICGTSTGSILACALAAGISINEIIKLYQNEGSAIFPSALPQKKWKKYLWGFLHLWKPSGNREKLKNILEGIFPAETIASMYEKRKIALCIPTINASNHKAWVFKTPHFPEKHRDNNYKLVDVCMASSAAPIFFPISSVKNPDNLETGPEQYFVDGGLWANNPVLIGLIEAIALTEKETPVEIVSIGTCELPTGDPSFLKSNMGIMDWEAGVGITEMGMSAQAFGYSNMASFLGKIFTDFGKPITVIRLKESPKSNKQLSAIGLDKADNTALQTLMDLAFTDADANHSEVQSNRNDSKNRILNEIFSNIPELEK